MEWTLNKSEKVYSIIKVIHPKYYEHLKKIEEKIKSKITAMPRFTDYGHPMKV